MTFWRRKGTDPQPKNPSVKESPEEPAQDGDAASGVIGERGVPPQTPFRSVQSRVSGVLTVTLMIGLAAGLLIYYYTHALTRGAHEKSAAAAAQARRAQGESSLRPLGPIRMAVPTSADSTVERILGPPPPEPIGAPEIPVNLSNPYATSGSFGTNNTAAPPPKTPQQLALERRLAGAVLRSAQAEPPSSSPMAGEGTMQAPPPAIAAESANATGSSNRADADPHGALSLDTLLHPTATPAVLARVLPTQRYLLPKGAFIDCTLETAINSSLPGMTTCITATDTFSADGSVVLLERGTKLVGETRGTVQQGSPRLFVLWTEARTPKGIIVPLASPGTDELGRSGLSGNIDWHWWQRFGAAILITVIDGAVAAATERSSESSVQINPSGASDVMSEMLRGTLAIAPTVDKPQGDRIQILVARDVDFRSVYALRAQGAGGQ
jgi:type IV secretion system protein VirB10